MINPLQINVTILESKIFKALNFIIGYTIKAKYENN